MSWREHTLPRPDVCLSWYDVGTGPAVVFLHGGPGVDHVLLRPVAERFAEDFRCALYDQRGEGRSRLERVDERACHVDRHVEDLDALRAELGAERLRLVGHSWGANLALLYGATHPERVERMALIGMGPLTDEMSAVYHANVQHPLSTAERAEWAGLEASSKAALVAGDAETFRRQSRRLTELHFRCWFYQLAVGAEYLPVFQRAAGDPYDAAIRYRHGTPRREWRLWERIARLTAPVLAMYGYQDCEPIVQAYLLRERLPQTQICLIHECSHWPWLDQPALFHRELSAFLRG